MIGNDIVDLSIAAVGEGRRRERFLQKIFTAVEIDAVKKAANEDFLIWLMWSIKESVYKIVVRQEGTIRYAPKSILCESIIATSQDKYESVVVYNGERFSAHSTIIDSCIHTVASNQHCAEVAVLSATLDRSREPNATKSLDQQVVAAICKAHSQTCSQVGIARDSIGIPRVYIDGVESGVLSLSHHGQYEGYCYLTLPTGDN